jgi:hypothetical protein
MPYMQEKQGLDKADDVIQGAKSPILFLAFTTRLKAVESAETFTARLTPRHSSEGSGIFCKIR